MFRIGCCLINESYLVISAFTFPKKTIILDITTLTKLSVFERYINRISVIDQKIRFGKTGNADNLARSIGISKRTLMLTFEIMRSMGAEIKFNRKINSYVYEHPVYFICEFRNHK